MQIRALIKTRKGKWATMVSALLVCAVIVWAMRARDTQTPYLDTRPLKVPGKAEIREYKAMFVLGDEEIGISSHELVVNCAP